MRIVGVHKYSKVKGKKPKTAAKLKKELWKHFTLYIKQRDNWTCFTCGRRVSGSNAHGGHFITKSIGGIVLYFEEKNVHCQCYNCNINLAGNIWEYGQRLGDETVKELYALKPASKKAKWDRDDFETKIAYYKSLTSPS